MKKLYVGVLFALALLFAQAASAEPCGLCQAYYPCDWPCEHCVEGNGGPGLWEIDGGCWGEVVPGTCGDIGQCGWQPCSTSWLFEPVVDPSVDPAEGVQSLPAPLPTVPPLD